MYKHILIPLENSPADETILTHILMTEKVAAVDLVELNPRFDIDSHGARLAAWLACQAVADWDRREDWE